MKRTISFFLFICLFALTACNPRTTIIPPETTVTATNTTAVEPPSITSTPLRVTSTPITAPTATPIPRPTVTAKPYPLDELLWTLMLGEGETGSWCDEHKLGAYWAQDLIIQTAQTYSIPTTNATGQYNVTYNPSGHLDGSPDGVEINWDLEQQTFCIHLNQALAPGDYSIRFIMNVGVDSPLDFPPIAEASRYLLIKVLPAVNLANTGDNVLAVVSDQGLALFDPDRFAYTQLTHGDQPIGPAWRSDGEWITYFSTSSQSVHLITADGSTNLDYAEDSYDPVFSNVDQVTFVSTSSMIHISNPDGSGYDLVEGEEPQWSPDGALIAYLKNSELWVIDPEGKNARQLATDVATPIRLPGLYSTKDFAWSPDGTKIAYVSTYGILTLIDIHLAMSDLNYAPQKYLAGVGQFRQFTETSGTSFMPRWSPDGSRIALECNGLCIADLNGNIERVYDLPRKHPNTDPLVFIISIAWSHDGQSVYLGARSAGILRYDARTGQTAPVLFSDFTEFYDLSNRPNP